MDFMQRALDLAKQGLGTTSPNPMVGAVIVKEGKIIAEGFHQKAGQDHAEIVALKNCKNPGGATLYVTLEPCAHYGRTPPCVDAVINAGIAKVVVAIRDPNPKTWGKSIEKLRQAGIEVVEGVMEQEARELNKVFFKYITTGLPYVYLKAALTLDGKIAAASGDSHWISCEESRKWVHQKRREVDAVLVGKNTVLKDDPQLTSRLEDVKYPVRIILADSIPNTAKVLNEPGKTILIQGDLRKELQKLAQQEISSILVEGGSEIYTQFIIQGLVDEYYFFIAPKLLGDGKALSLFERGTVERIADCLKLRFTAVEKVGEDVLIVARQQNI